MPPSRWDQPPPLELRLELSTLLPPELVLLVLTLGAYEYRHLAATLLRVSQWTQALVQPLFFRTIHLRSQTVLPIFHQIIYCLPPTFFMDNPVHTLVVDYDILPGTALASACARARTLVVHASLLPSVLMPFGNSLHGFAPRMIVIFGILKHVLWSAPCFARLERLICADEFPSFASEADLPSLVHMVVPARSFALEHVNDLSRTQPDVRVTAFDVETVDHEGLISAMPNVTRTKWRFDFSAFDPWRRDGPFEGLFEYDDGHALSTHSSARPSLTLSPK